MEEPRPGVVGHESDGDVVRSRSNVDGVTLHGVEVVVLCRPSASHDVKRVLTYRLSAQGIGIK